MADDGNNERGITTLMLACQDGNLDKIQQLMDENEIAPSAVDQHGKVALHYCAENGDFDAFKRVFDADSSLMDKRDNDGYTPLTFAVVGGHAQVADFLLRRGSEINNVDNEKHTLVHWATVCGQTEILQILLKKGALASTPDLYGAYALHYASQSEDLEILRLLLKYSANANCADFDERTPLMWAATCGNGPAVLALLEAGADKHAVDKDHLTVLHCAAGRGHSHVIAAVCRSASDVQLDARDRNGCSALAYAAAMGYADAVDALLEHGAFIDSQDRKLRTGAHCAAARGQLATLKVLHQYGASFALENHRGDLPLHEAVQSGSFELVDWLLTLTPKQVNAMNHDGRRPLHLAAALGHLRTCRLLIDRGADVDALMLNKDDCVTALDLAEQKKQDEVIAYLTEIGAKRCRELTPEGIVEEFKKHMQTRATTSQKRGESPLKTTTTEAQTDDTPKMDQSVATNPEQPPVLTASDLMNSDKKRGPKRSSKSSKKERRRAKQQVNGEEADDDTNLGDDQPPPIALTSDASEKQINEKKQRKKGSAVKPKLTAAMTATTTDAIKPQEKPTNKDEHSSRTSAGFSELHSVYEVDETSDGKGQRSEVDRGRSAEEDRSSRVDRKLLPVNGQLSETNSPLNSLRQSDRSGNKSRVGTALADETLRLFRIDWERSLKSSVRRYAEEKRIFQELANLKRLQTQYGHAQEDVIVRKSIDTFLQGYNVDANDVQLRTYGAWEKFLYDQLKIIYRKEKESLVTKYEEHINHQASMFERRLKASNGRLRSDNKIDQLSRTYGIAPVPMQYSPRLHSVSTLR